MSEIFSSVKISRQDYDVLVPEEHQYDSHIASEVSYYQFRRLTPLTEPVLSLNGTCISEFEITPGAVFNLSKSFLEADIVFASGGNGYAVCAHSGFCAFIDQLEFLDAGGRQLAWLNYPEQYTKITWPACTPMDDFLSNSGASISATTAAVGGIKTTLMNRNNVANTTDPIGPAAAPSVPLYTAPTTIVADPQCNFESYTGIQHKIVSNDGAGLALRLQIPLKQFYQTIFSCNKDLYFGQTTTIRITWNQGVRMGFISTTTGTVGVTSALTTSPTISNDRIRLAQQSNPIEAETIKSKVNNEGIHLFVPYVWGFKYTLPNGGPLTTQSFDRKINKNHGQRLLRVWTAQFNQSGEAGGAFYCQNINSLTAAGNDAMFSEVGAQLDSVNLQENNLVNKNCEVYEFLQAKIDYSAGGSLSQYLAGAYMLNDFTPWKSVEFATGDMTMSGLSLSEDRQYSINFISNQVPISNPVSNGVNLYYMFVVTQKFLSITKMGVTFA